MKEAKYQKERRIIEAHPDYPIKDEKSEEESEGEKSEEFEEYPNQKVQGFKYVNTKTVKKFDNEYGYDENGAYMQLGLENKGQEDAPSSAAGKKSNDESIYKEMCFLK